MVSQADENLPEVVPHTGPEWISLADAQRAWGYEEHDPKYLVQYDTADTANKEILFSPLSPGGTAVPGGFTFPAAMDATPPNGTSPTAAASPVDTGRGAVTAADATHGDNASSGGNQDGGTGSGGGEEEFHSEKAGDDPDPIILRMRKRTFIIVVAAIVLLLVGLAIGLGVGLTKRNTGDAGDTGDAEAVGDATGTSSSSTPRTTSSTATTSSSSTTTSSTTTTSTSGSASGTSSSTLAPIPTGEVFGDQDFAFQGWSDESYTGQRTAVYKSTGFWYFGFNITSYVWDHGTERCCVTFCQGKNGTGWWCDDRGQPKASKPIDHIQIWCDQMNDVHIGQCTEES